MEKKGYDEFKELLVEKFGGECAVTFRKVDKIGGSYNGVTFTKASETVGSTVDIDNIYNEYINSSTDVDSYLDGLYNFILNDLSSCTFASLQSQVDNIVDLISDPTKYMVRLCSSERRKDYLEDKVWRPYLNLAVVAYVEVVISEDKKGAIILTKDMIKDLDLSEDEIIDTAIQNSLTMESPYYENMMDVLGFPADSNVPPVFVVSNTKRTNGAYALLDTNGVLKALESELGEEYFILPSSTHEILCMANEKRISDEEFSEKLLEMVQDVNSSTVEEQDYLSTCVYKYSNGVVQIANSLINA